MEFYRLLQPPHLNVSRREEVESPCLGARKRFIILSPALFLLVEKRENCLSCLKIGTRVRTRARAAQQLPLPRLLPPPPRHDFLAASLDTLLYSSYSYYYSKQGARVRLKKTNELK